MEPCEDTMLIFTLEVQHVVHGTVVFAFGFVKVNPSHITLGEMSFSEISNAAVLHAIYPDLLADHQRVGVVIQDHVIGRRTAKSGFTQPKDVKL